MMIAGEKNKVERCGFDWTILNFDDQFADLSKKKFLSRDQRNADKKKQDNSDLELLSEHFIRGQTVQRTSSWQLALRRKGPDISLSLYCIQCFHEGIEDIWTRFDADVVDFYGRVCYSASGGSHFNSENLTCFTPHAKLNDPRECHMKGKTSFWETDLISISELSKNWKKFVPRNVLNVCLRLYIYREKPFNEASHMAEFHEPVQLRYTDISLLPLSTPLLQAVRSLWETKKDADVNFLVEGKPVKAHKFIMAVQSPIMKKIIDESRHYEQSTGRCEINIPGVSYSAFLPLLQYLYTQDVSSIKNSNDVQFIANVLDVCNKFGIEPLAKICLARLLTNMTVENFGDTAFAIYSFVDRQDSYFKTEVKRFLMENQSNLQESEQFKEHAKKNPDTFLQLCFQPIQVIRNEANTNQG